MVAAALRAEHSLVATTAAAVDEMTSARAAPILIQGNERPGGAARALLRRPLPGDAIIAGMRRGRRSVVHTADCPVAMRAQAREPERWVTVAWDAQTAKHLSTRLDIVTRNERGVLGRIAAEVTAADANIMHVTMHDDAIATVTRAPDRAGRQPYPSGPGDPGHPAPSHKYKNRPYKRLILIPAPSKFRSSAGIG